MLICKHPHPTHKLLDRVHSTVGGVGFEFEVSGTAECFDEIEYFKMVLRIPYAMMMTMNMMKMVNLSSVMRTVSLKTVLMPWLMVTAGLLFKLRDFED